MSCAHCVLGFWETTHWRYLFKKKIHLRKSFKYSKWTHYPSMYIKILFLGWFYQHTNYFSGYLFRYYMHLHTRPTSHTLITSRYIRLKDNLGNVNRLCNHWEHWPWKLSNQLELHLSYLRKLCHLSIYLVWSEMICTHFLGLGRQVQLLNFTWGTSTHLKSDWLIDWMLFINWVLGKQRV